MPLVQKDLDAEIGVNEDPAFIEAERRVLQHLSYRRAMSSKTKPQLVSLCKARSLILKSASEKTAGTVEVLLGKLCQHKYPLTRKLELQLRADLLEKASYHGYVHMPILRGLSLHDVVLDTLHLLLRVGDRLLLLLFTVDVFPHNLEDLVVEQMHESSVNFNFFPSKDPQKGDGVGTAWSSIQGDAMDTIIRTLNIARIVGDVPRARQLRKLWTDFASLLDRLDDWKVPESLDDLQRDLDAWHEDFLRLYGNNDFTPYLHMFCYHTVAMVRRHGGLRKFKCQASEKHNNQHQKAWHRCTNKGGGRACMSAFYKSPECQILLRDIRERDPENDFRADMFLCDSCIRQFSRYGDLHNHYIKEHT